MKVILLITLCLGANLYAEEKTDLQFALKVKREIRERFHSGNMVYEYQKGVLVKTWKNKNLSATDVKLLISAYKDAIDIERRIYLKGQLDKEGYIYTEYPETMKPVLPKTKKPAQ